MKIKFEKKYKHSIIVIMIFIGLFSVISSVSAEDTIWQPSYDLDKGHKTFNIENKKYKVSWNAYRFSQKANATIYINKEYKFKNKKNKTIFKADSYYTINKVKKNRIKVKVSYSTGPPNVEVKIYRTKLSVRAFYWRYIETKFTSKFDRKILSKDSLIDKGDLKTILPYKGSPGSNISTAKYSLYWNTKTYSEFPKIICIIQGNGTNPINPPQNYPIMIGGPDALVWDSYVTILEKTKKNKIKITIVNSDRINGNTVKDKVYTAKTKLSLKNYYFNVFKPKMIKMFSMD